MVTGEVVVGSAMVVDVVDESVSAAGDPHADTASARIATIATNRFLGFIVFFLSFWWT